MSNQTPENTTPRVVDPTPPESRPQVAFRLSSGKKKRALDFGSLENTAKAVSMSTGSTKNSVNKAWVGIWRPTLKPLDTTALSGETLKLPFGGVVVTPSCRMGDKLAGLPFYRPGTHEGKQAFIDATGFVPRSFNASTGNFKEPREYFNKDKSYPWKSFVAMTDDEDTLNLETVSDFINKGLVPAWKTFNSDFPEYNDMNLSEDILPTIGNINDTETVTVHEHLSDFFINSSDVIFCINNALYNRFKDENVNLTFKDWCRYDPRHIYTIFPRGQIPHDVIRKHKLDEKCMCNEDYSQFLQAMQRRGNSNKRAKTT